MRKGEIKCHAAAGGFFVSPLPAPYNPDKKKTMRRRRSVFEVSYPPAKVQFLLSSSSGGEMFSRVSTLGRLSPTKRADFSYQVGGSLTTKRAGVSYQTGNPTLPDAVHYQTGGVVAVAAKSTAEEGSVTCIYPLNARFPTKRAAADKQRPVRDSLPNGRNAFPIPT
jgi:hypothetical protein